LKKLITTLLALIILFALATPAYASGANFATRMDSSITLGETQYNFHTFSFSGQNHIRIRDLAYILSATPMRFSVAWNAASKSVLLGSDLQYVPVGGELSPADTTRLTGTLESADVQIDQHILTIPTINIGGEAFFRLRDIADAFGFSIGWSTANNSIVLGSGANQIEYSVSASQGSGAFVRILDPARPVVALTFDDGPKATTNTVLDILAQHDVQATFFIIGSHIGNRQSTVLRAHNAGHEIANHTWSHARLPNVSTSQISDEIERTNNLIESIIGVRPTLFRAPFGAIDSRVEAVTASLGHPIIRWSLDTRDWETRNADATFNVIMNNVKENLVYSH